MSARVQLVWIDYEPGAGPRGKDLMQDFEICHLVRNRSGVLELKQVHARSGPRPQDSER